MKQEHYKNLRYCEKIRQTECFIEADGLQKKIRKMKAGLQKDPIDAQSKMRQINCFWKEGWEYDHTHHTFIEPRITTPQIFLKNPLNAHSSLDGYYKLLINFATKLKIEHQDETNYRIDLQLQPYKFIEQPEKITAEKAFNHLLSILNKATSEMRNHFNKSQNQASNFMQVLIDTSLGQKLQFLKKICSKFSGQDMTSEQQQQEISNIQSSKTETINFISFMIKQIIQSKQSKMFTSVIAIQPELGQLTYLLHPLCWALYGIFSHEQIIRSAKKRRGKCDADQLDKPLPLKHDDLVYNKDQFLHISQNSNIQQQKHSKIALINLDGYQSEYTIQFMRNFYEHILYISFPKFDNKNESHSFYHHNFYKKIMFNSTKSITYLFPQQKNIYGLTQTIIKQELQQNPQNYHETITNLYKPSQKINQFIDHNKNIFIFPIQMTQLKSNIELTQQDRNISLNQTYFIKYLFEHHLKSHLINFKPNTILISYSGRIHLLNQHFMQIIQQLQKICPKILLFPNLTSPLTRSSTNTNLINELFNVQHKSPWDRFVSEYHTENGSQIELMEKLSIFLKVGSGHYNLQQVCQQQTVDIRFKNSRIFNYIIHLFNALKHQYDHCKKRIQRDSMQASKMVLNKGLKEYATELDRCIPPYYRKLFLKMSQLIQGNYNLQLNKSNQSLLEQLTQNNGRQNLIEMWNQLKEIECISLASSKYQELSYLQIHTEPGKIQFGEIKGDKMDNLDNIYRLSFCDRERNTEIVKIYKEATLLYQPLQHFHTHKHYFNLILTNLLDLSSQHYQNYFTRPKISNRKHQRCPIVPIQFLNNKGIPLTLQEGQVLTQWSYAQTQNYIILYWPKLFDSITHILHSLLKRQYLPETLPKLYVATKNHDLSARLDHFNFYQLNIPEDILYQPRWGCSAFFIDDQFFIFGGFHNSQSSYLDLQNEISTIDLSGFAPQSYEPRKIANLRKELYCGQAFNGHLRMGRRPSSFVRPRMQFQFYDYDQLNLDEDMGEDGIRRIIMIGGVGEDFKTPHSLFVNYFYILRFDIATRRLLSIQKKFIQNKAIPINVRGMIRNRGLFRRANILDQREGIDPQNSRCREGIMNPHHHVAHRVVFALKGGQLQARVKNLYALQLYDMYKRDFHSFGNFIGDIRSVEEMDQSSVSIRKLEGNNHHLLVQVNQSLFLYSLYLELLGDQIEQVPLMNQSIISLDTKKLTVFALVSHSKYTQNKTYLVTETMPEPEPMIIKQQKHYALVLKKLLAFPHTLSLHILIACNANEVVVLQGLAIQGNTVQEYLVKVKSNNDGQVKKEPKLPPTISLQQGQNITSFFYRKNNIITCFSFVRYPNHNQLLYCKHTINLQRFSQGWKMVQNQHKICFINNGYIIRVSNIDLRLQNIGDSNILMIIQGYCGDDKQQRSYIVKLNIIDQESNINTTEIKGEELKRIKNHQGLPFVVKTVDKYNDYGYFKQQQ